MQDIVVRLRTWAEDDVRAIARDMPIMGISVDTHDVRVWGDLMDEAATEIECLRKMVDHAASQGVTFPADCLPQIEASVVVVDPNDGSERVVFDPDLQKSVKH